MLLFIMLRWLLTITRQYNFDPTPGAVTHWMVEWLRTKHERAEYVLSKPSGHTSPFPRALSAPGGPKFSQKCKLFVLQLCVRV